MGTMTMIGVKYRTTLKGPGSSGALRMTEDKFTFTPDDPPSLMKLTVDFRSIKGHKCNKVDDSKPAEPLLNLLRNSDKGGGYIFEFDNVGNRDLCRDFAARVFAEMEWRTKLLREDSELQKLHKKFVVSNILQESEFWATRKNLPDDEANKTSKQKPGFRSAMAANVSPSADGQAFYLGTDVIRLCDLWLTSKVTISMTSEMIYEVFLRPSFTIVSTVISAVIFVEKPAVRQAFLDYVPKKIKGVDRTLDMFLKDDYLHLADHGLLYDGSGETTDTDCELAWRTLSQDLNRHAAVVLEGRSIDIKSTDAKTVAEALARSRKEPPSSSVADDVSHEKLVKVSRATEIEDLQVPRSLQYAPLCIKNTREYFDSQQANALRSSGDNNDDAFRHLMDQISSVKLNCPFVQSDVALKVLNELNEGISRSWRLNLKNSQDSLLGRLLHRTRDELMDHWMAIQELLRQFWSSYPITTAALSNKVQRVLDAMSQIYQKLQDMKESAQPDVRHDVSRLVKPMIQALDAAFNHDLDQQEKSSKAPTGFEQRTLHP